MHVRIFNLSLETNHQTFVPFHLHCLREAYLRLIMLTCFCSSCVYTLCLKKTTLM